MPLVAAKCTNCGSNLQVESTKEAAVCEYCGSAFIVEKAINNYNISRVEHLHADVVQIMDSDAADNLHRSAMTYLKMDSVKEAAETFEKMRQKYPFDSRGWYGAMQTDTKDFSQGVATPEFYGALLDKYEKYLAVVRQGGHDEQECIQKVENYLNWLEGAIEKQIEPMKAEAEKLSVQAEADSRRLGDPSKQIARQQKQKKSYAVRTSIITAAVSLFVWINGIIAGVGETEFFGGWEFEHQGAYWDFWRNLLFIHDGTGGMLIGLLGPLVLTVVGLLCWWVIHQKWKNIDKQIEPLAKQQSELTRSNLAAFNAKMRIQTVEEKLPQLRSRRQKISQMR